MDHRVNTSIVFVSRTSRTADCEAFRSGDYRLEPEEIKEDAINRTKIIHPSTWVLSKEPCRSAVRHAFDIALKKEKIISFDPNYNPDVWLEFRQAHKVIEEMLGIATIVKASRDDATRIFGRGKSPEKYLELFHRCGPDMDNDCFHHGGRWHSGLGRR
jgi:fructokinase